jgi:hypothetical protein
MSSIVSDRIQFARTSNREGPTGANRARATCLAPILQIRTIRGMVVPPSTPTPQPSPPTEILPAWISSDPAPTEFQSAGAFGYSRWMSGYPGGDIRHSVPTEMPSTGISRYPASTEIRSTGTFRYLAGMCGYSTPTGIQSAPIRRPVKRIGAAAGGVPQRLPVASEVISRTQFQQEAFLAKKVGVGCRRGDKAN